MKNRMFPTGGILLLVAGLLVTLVFVRLVMAYYDHPYARGGGLVFGSSVVQISSQAADLALGLGLLVIVLGVFLISRSRRKTLVPAVQV